MATKRGVGSSMGRGKYSRSASDLAVQDCAQPRARRACAGDTRDENTLPGGCRTSCIRGKFRSSLGEHRPIPIRASSSSRCTRPKNDRCGDGAQPNWIEAQLARVEQATHGAQMPATGSARRRTCHFPRGWPTHPRKPLRASESLGTTSTSTSSLACESSADAGSWFQSASLTDGSTSTPPGCLADHAGILTTHA